MRNRGWHVALAASGLVAGLLLSSVTSPAGAQTLPPGIKLPGITPQAPPPVAIPPEPPAPPAAPEPEPAPAPIPSPTASLSMKVRTVEVRDIVLGTPDASLAIDRIAFTGFVREGERVHADKMEIEAVKGQAGTLTLEIPKLSLSGVDLPASVFAALTGEGTPADWLAALEQTGADQLAVEQIVVRDPSVPLEMAWSVGANGFKGGILSSARLAGLRLKLGAEADVDRVEASIGEIRYQDVDLAEFLRYGGGGQNGGEPKPLVQRSIADAIEVSARDVKLRLDRVELSGLEGRAPVMPFDIEAVMAEMEREGPKPETVKQMIAYVEELQRTFRIARYGFEGLSVSVKDAGEVRVSAMTFSGLSGFGIDRAELVGLDMPLPGSSIKLGRFELERIKFGNLAEMATSALGLDNGVPPSPARMIEIGPRIGSTHLARLEMTTPQGPFSLGDFRFEIDDGNGKMPERVTAALSGLRLDLARMQSNPGIEKLKGLGYSDVNAAAQFQVRWLPTERAVVLENTGAAIDKAGRIEVSLRFGNVDAAAALAHPEVAEQILSTARFESAQARVIDLGFAERFFADVAKTAGAPPDAIRTALAADMRQKAIQAGGPMLAPGSADALAQFLRAPSRITATLTPRFGQPPVTLADLNHPDEATMKQRLLLTLEVPAN